MATSTSVTIGDDLLAFTGNRGHLSALAFVRIGGTELSEMLFAHAKAKETERMGPIEAAVFLETHYPVDAIPVVGSKMEEVGNKPYDRYTVEVQTADGKRKVPGSFFTDVVKNTSAAITLAKRIKWCADIKWVSDDGEECPQDIKDMGTGERTTEEERCRLAVKDMRTSLTKGAMLLQHCEEIKVLNPDKIKVKLPVREERVLKDGQPVVIDGEEQTRTKVYGSLIRLQDPSSVHEDISFTVTQFNQLRPAKLTGPSAEYTIKKLEDTAERAPRGSGGNKGQANATANAYPVPKTLEQLLSCLNAIASGLDNGTEEGQKMFAQFIARCNTEKAGDEYILSGGAAAQALDNWWNLFGSRYLQMQATIAQAKNAAAAAQRMPKTGT